MYDSRGFYRPTAVCGACQTPHHATAVTAPSRPASAEAAAGFVSRLALAGYPSHSTTCTFASAELLPGSAKVFEEMTGWPQRRRRRAPDGRQGRFFPPNLSDGWVMERRRLGG
jgi:hypothetical protein